MVLRLLLLFSLIGVVGINTCVRRELELPGEAEPNGLVRIPERLLVSANDLGTGRLFLLSKNLTIEDEVDVGTYVGGIDAIGGGLFAVASGADDAELLIFDSNLDEVGRTDVPGTEDPCSVGYGFNVALLGMPSGRLELVSMVDPINPVWARNAIVAGLSRSSSRRDSRRSGAVSLALSNHRVD